MKKKTIISTLFLTILVFILTGCTYGELKGQVINKKNTPIKTIMQPIYTGKTMMIFPRTYLEKWEIQIQKEENRRNKNNLGKCFTRRI